MSGVSCVSDEMAIAGAQAMWNHARTGNRRMSSWEEIGGHLHGVLVAEARVCVEAALVAQLALDVRVAAA